MRSGKRSFAAAMLTVMALAACSKSVPSFVPDIGGLDTGQVQASSAKIRSAAAMCSSASGRISDLTQQMLKAVGAKDAATIQSVGAELQTAADQLHQSATDGQAASQGLSSLPAGSQAVAGTAAAFKICGATGDLAESVATDVATAKGDAAYKQLDKALKALSDKAAKAGQEALGAG